MPYKLDKWTSRTLDYLGMKVSSVPSGPMKLDKKQKRLKEVKFTGDKRPFALNFGGRFVIGSIWGDKAERHEIPPESKKKIDTQHSLGTAAPVSLKRNGKEMRGSFFSAKGHNLKDKKFKPDLSRPVVLLLTGSEGSSEGQGIDMVEFYQEKGASVLSVNYLGFGSSDDTNASEQGLYEDAQEMLNYLVSLGYKTKDIIIHGYSMGGSVASILEQKNEKNGVKFRGTVLDRPMTSAHDAIITQDKVKPIPLIKSPISHIAAFLGGKFKTKERVKKLDKKTRKIVTLDSGDLGPFGEIMRKQMGKDGHKILNSLVDKKDRGDHFDHKKMLENNKSSLEELIGEDVSGKKTKLDSPKSEKDEWKKLVESMEAFDKFAKDIEEGMGHVACLKFNIKNYKTIQVLMVNLNKVIKVRDMIIALQGTKILELKEFSEVKEKVAKHLKNADEGICLLEKKMLKLDSSVAKTLALDELNDEKDIYLLFKDPSKSDPLGTRAFRPKTILGKAISKVRKENPTNCKWQSVQKLSSSVFEKAVLNERKLLLQIIAGLSN